MKIAIGGDHAGYTYKQEIISMLTQAGHEVKDFGPFSDASVDYPDFAHPLSISVENGENELGILICGSGNGVALTANKHQGIRAALCWLDELGALARQHNDANVMALPARYITIEEAKKCVDAFTTEKFEGGRHQDRVLKIDL
jgi:ribose 5-phosphate isomerase B